MLPAPGILRESFMEDQTEIGLTKLGWLKRSTIAISTVVAVEVTLGLLVGSLSIISDGLHALLDATTSFALFYATRESLKPPDEEHMYGHEKYEAIGGFMGGLALIGVSLLIMYEAINRFVNNQGIDFDYEAAGYVAIGYTFCIDFFRVGTFRKAFHAESSTVRAGLYHALADLASTVIAFVGFGLATLGVAHGDALGGLVLAVLLAFLSVRLIWSTGQELSDRVSRDVVEKIRKELQGSKSVREYRNLKVRKAGSRVFVRVDVQVPDYVTFEESHTVASDIESTIKRSLGNAEVIVHVEPPQAGEPTEKIVAKLATEVPGVQEAHDVNAVCEENKVYVTLHARVDPKTPIREAHEKAEEIERKIRQNVRDVENVTVHIEPATAHGNVGAELDEAEIKSIIGKIAEQWPGAFEIRRTLTYVAHRKRYVNIDCIFSREVSIEEAHTISTRIEEEVQKRFSETIVTVHMEPEPD